MLLQPFVTLIMEPTKYISSSYPAEVLLSSQSHLFPENKTSTHQASCLATKKETKVLWTKTIPETMNFLNKNTSLEVLFPRQLEAIRDIGTNPVKIKSIPLNDAPYKQDTKLHISQRHV